MGTHSPNTILGDTAILINFNNFFNIFLNILRHVIMSDYCLWVLKPVNISVIII